MSRVSRCAVLAALLLAAAAGSAPAQTGYPNRPVTFIVPFAPGGTTDILARLISQKLEQRLGKPFVVENRPGAGGVTAAVAVSRAVPDGYTVIMASSTMLAINISIRKNLPYDPRKDLTPLALLARVPYVLVVNPSLPVHSVADLVRLAKEKPGQLSYGTPGPGTFHHLNAESFKTMFGVELTHVPYKGSLPALSDLAGGHIQMMFCDIPPTVSLIQSGKLRPLGVTTPQRVPVLPEVAPLSEAGMPGYDASSWHTVTTTAGVPKPIVDTLHTALREIMGDPAVVEALARDGAVAQTSPPPEELKRFVEREIERWGKVVERAGIAGTQ